MNDSDSKQAIPSPEDRVRAMPAEKLLDIIQNSGGCALSAYQPLVKDARAELLSRLSLVEELKGQVASASPQPRCPICHATDLTIYTSPSATVRVHCSDDQTHPSFYLDTVADCAQFFPAAPATEVGLLRKRKDYHAEYHAPQSENEHKTWCSHYLPAPQPVSGDAPDMNDPRYCGACKHIHPPHEVDCRCYCDKVSCPECGPRIAARVMADPAPQPTPSVSTEPQMMITPGGDIHEYCPDCRGVCKQVRPAPSVAGTQPTCKVCNLPKFNVWSTAPPGTMIYDLPKYFCNCMDGGTWGLSNLPSQQMTAHSGTVNPGASQGTPQVEEIKRTLELMRSLYSTVEEDLQSGRCSETWPEIWQSYVEPFLLKHGVGAPAQPGTEEKK